MLYKAFARVKENWQAGLTVSLVSIPLALSLAVASGATPTMGILTAVWAGLVASFFGSSNYNIIGPTGALSGIIAAYAFVYGAGSIPFLALLTGFFILTAYIFHLERYLIYVPSSVIHGFTLGVALIIILNQLNYALGLKNIPQHEVFFKNILESLSHISEISLVTLAVFVSFFIMLLLVRWLAPKIPGVILIAPLGIAFGYASKHALIPFVVETLGEKFADVSFKLFIAPQFSWYPHILQTAAVIALVAILETMLSAKIADGMTHTKHNPHKEMLGLGLANVVSGLLGGIPATAALARTALNIKTRATYKTAATLCSIFIGLIAFFLLSYFAYLPLAVIAAILVFVSVQMIEAEHFVAFFKYEQANFWISMLVAFITVYKDPIAGILLGATISLLLLVDKISRGQCEIIINKRIKADSSEEEKIKEPDKNADVLVYSIKGKLCYINSRAHVARFETTFSKYKYIILRLREIYFIDLDGIEALDEIIEIAHTKGQKILITSVSPTVAPLLDSAAIGYQKLKKDGLVFKKTQEALAYLEANHNISLPKK